jgi:hypothetical protein
MGEQIDIMRPTVTLVCVVDATILLTQSQIVAAAARTMRAAGA